MEIEQHCNRLQSYIMTTASTFCSSPVLMLACGGRWMLDRMTAYPRFELGGSMTCPSQGRLREAAMGSDISNHPFIHVSSNSIKLITLRRKIKFPMSGLAWILPGSLVGLT